ncbi:hypothetical protein SAY87_013299 [Trapa incisa]|uniref:Uncharacterized protein n=1 Tax=Trapa incisa TaxID=236973 RepID=A0AAN7QCS5_9MYRT|nr:hypothetical protein SAY87_013299 [Trapa incisa]
MAKTLSTVSDANKTIETVRGVGIYPAGQQHLFRIRFESCKQNPYKCIAIGGLSQMSMAKLLLISMQEAIWWGKSNSSLIWVEGVPEQTGAPPVAWVAVSGQAPNPPPIQPTQPA